MLSRSSLARLERSLRELPVLTVYLDGSPSDPAMRGAWCTRLNDALAATRAAIADRSERWQFDAASALLHAEIESSPVPPAGTSWLALVTAQGIEARTSLAYPTPLLARWGPGAIVAPALRALGDDRSMLVAIADSRSARILRYSGGELEHKAALMARSIVDPPSHMTAPPRPGFHPGTRGTSGRDAAERDLRAGRLRMITELTAKLADLARADDWILVGGAPAAAHEALAALPANIASRALLVHDLHPHSAPSRIARCAEHGASVLRRREELGTVGALLENAGAGGRAAAGAADVGQALVAGAIRTLLLSTSFIDDAPEDAERLVREAFDQGAEVEVIVGEAARLLDESAKGVGAVLRFAHAPMLSTA